MNVEPNTIPQLYTANQIAKLFSISLVTLYRLVESRKIPFFRIGSSIRFTEEDVLSYLKDNRIGSTG